MAEKSRSRWTESFTDKDELHEQQTMSRDGSLGDGESFETEEKTGPTPRTMSRFTATLRSCGRQAWDPSGFGSVRKAPVSTNYDVGKKIGSGAFASVYVATARKDRALAPCPDAYLQQEKVAVKMVDVSTLDAAGLDAMELEVRTMRRVAGHENIAALYEIYIFDKTLALVMELCAGGELFDRIISKDHYSEREARLAFAQMVEAIGHCHAREVVHRDLKPENLLYADVEGAPNGSVVKLADFGLARTLEPGRHLSGFSGTPGYVAPEILTSTRSYGKECDLWSLGVVLYIILCGYPPFYHDHGDPRIVFAQIRKCQFQFQRPYWDDVTKEAKDLVTRLLTKDPAKRLTADGVFKHDWVRLSPVTNLHLPYFATNVKKYRLRRKFKAAVLSVAAEMRFASFARRGAFEGHSTAEAALGVAGRIDALASRKSLSVAEAKQLRELMIARTTSSVERMDLAAAPELPEGDGVAEA